MGDRKKPPKLHSEFLRQKRTEGKALWCEVHRAWLTRKGCEAVRDKAKRASDSVFRPQEDFDRTGDGCLKCPVIQAQGNEKQSETKTPLRKVQKGGMAARDTGRRSKSELQKALND